MIILRCSKCGETWQNTWPYWTNNDNRPMTAEEADEHFQKAGKCVRCGCKPRSILIKETSSVPAQNHTIKPTSLGGSHNRHQPGKGLRSACTRFLCLVGLHIPTLDGRLCRTCRKNLEPEGRVYAVKDSENFQEELIERGERGKGR